jgi:2-polyprenyl-3-methyl-5-hydroxy-6-metoxy-1,4-benzoquinol methylase
LKNTQKNSNTKKEPVTKVKKIQRKDNLKTQVIPNFFNNSELFEIEKIFRTHSDTIIQIEKMGVELGNEQGMTHPEARAHYWFPGPSSQHKIGKILSDKLSHYFSREIMCTDWHILNSFQPYDIHADGYDLNNLGTHLPEGWEYAYTFLIPLDTYDTKTIIFEQESYTFKGGRNWLKHDKPELLDVIDDDTHKKYFSHCDREIVRHLSIDTEFKWEKGELLAASRHALHASDNYLNNRILEKRALVGWSIKPKLIPEQEAMHKFNTVDGYAMECRKLNSLPWTGSAYQFSIQKDDETVNFPVWFAHATLIGLLHKTQFKTVLDIGCGEGLVSNIFKSLNKQVTTIEPGESKPRLPEFDPINIDYKDDYLNIDFKEKFDVIWCSHVLEHIRNPATFLDKIFTDLNEGGTLALTVPYNDGGNLESVVDSHINKFTIGTLLYNLICSGFDCRDIQVVIHNSELSVLLKKVFNGIAPYSTARSFGEIISFFPETDIQHTYRDDNTVLSLKANGNSINWTYPI